MTADEFRVSALKIPGAIEYAHMRHADFRLNGKIFATLGYPDDEHAMVKLTPDLQREFIEKAPGEFAPAPGTWGKQGSTLVKLAAARLPVVREAVHAASHQYTQTRKRPNQAPEPTPPSRRGSS